MEHTILDFYGTPYGGLLDNASRVVRSGSNSYESETYSGFRLYRYGDLLDELDTNPDVTNNKGGIA